MKTLVSILLALAIGTLPLDLRADPPPDDPSQEFVWVPVVLVVVVVIVGGTVVYTVKKCTDASKVPRCGDCNRVLPQGITLCPLCGHENNPNKPQANSHPYEYPTVSEIQLAQAGGSWETIHAEAWDTFHAPDVEIQTAPTLEAWIAANSEFGEPVVLDSRPISSGSLFRILEH